MPNNKSDGPARDDHAERVYLKVKNTVTLRMISDSMTNLAA